MFEFDFQGRNIDDCIKETEVCLREIVNNRMSSKYGPGWISKSELGLDSIWENAKKTKEDDSNKFGDQKISHNLLDYTYIVHLKELIINKFWDQFENIFPPKKVTEHYLDTINAYRNPTAHVRESLMEHQRYLCLGICGELMYHIHRYNLGFRHIVHGFYCQFGFSVYPNTTDTNDMEREATKRGNEWIDLVQSLSNKPVEEHETGMFNAREKLIRFSNGNMTITYPRTAQQYDGRYFYTCIIQAYFDNAQLLDKIVKEGRHPYYVLYFLLKNELDIPGIVSQIKYRTGRTP